MNERSKKHFKEVFATVWVVQEAKNKKMERVREKCHDRTTVKVVLLYRWFTRNWFIIQQLLL